MLIRMVFACGLMGAMANLASAEEPGYFCQGTWTGTAIGSYVKSFDAGPARMGSGSVGMGYYVFDNFGVNLELAGYYDSQAGPDSRIASGDLLVRHHLLHAGRFSFFLDGVAGVSYADKRLPTTPLLGTHFNFILEAGIGATFQIYDNLHLIGGVRYFHLSNARLEGPIHNPSINAIQPYVGLMLKM